MYHFVDHILTYVPKERFKSQSYQCNDIQWGWFLQTSSRFRKKSLCRLSCVFLCSNESVCGPIFASGLLRLFFWLMWAGSHIEHVTYGKEAGGWCTWDSVRMTHEAYKNIEEKASCPYFVCTFRQFLGKSRFWKKMTTLSAHYYYVQRAERGHCIQEMTKSWLQLLVFSDYRIFWIKYCLGICELPISSALTHFLKRLLFFYATLRIWASVSCVRKK